ncbi:SDR family NAD(P)-dependent oxidoreductase [Rhodococcus rhodnii]|nr:SDR family NAD(P)-dependent oxidoreductase [Rhodococcus rhodnii]
MNPANSMNPMTTVGPLLAGRRAVVTGGARGIGAAIVVAFATHGAHVTSLDVVAADDPVFDPAAGGTIESVLADARDATTADLVVAARPDVLVNNVGHFLRPPRRFAETEPAWWDELAEINLGHVLRLTHAALPVLAPGASIVNLTTVEAHRAIPGHTVYSAYKAAVHQFTRSLAVEEGPRGIRVNAIAPDLIDSVQVPYDDIVAEEDRGTWPRWAPLGGPGTPEDVAGAALFLGSELSRYVTGTTIHVGGGSKAAGGWFARAEGGWTNRPRHA